MLVKAIVAEDFVNYKQPSMFISTCKCTWKCCTDLGLDIGVCQNSPLSQSENIEVKDEAIYEHFSTNPITKAIVLGGLEPMLQLDEVLNLIKLFREKGDNSPFIIYTGYYPEEMPEAIEKLKKYKNIIIKFGRYIPDNKGRFDEVLGVHLASDNQYAKQIS